MAVLRFDSMLSTMSSGMPGFTRLTLKNSEPARARGRWAQSMHAGARRSAAMAGGAGTTRHRPRAPGIGDSAQCFAAASCWLAHAPRSMPSTEPASAGATCASSTASSTAQQLRMVDRSCVCAETTHCDTSLPVPLWQHACITERRPPKRSARGTSSCKRCQACSPEPGERCKRGMCCS